METLKYTVIRTPSQYQAYCQQLETLLATDPAPVEEIDLLTLLVETWDQAHCTLPAADPIDLLKSLLTEKGLKAKDLAVILQVSQGTVSDILSRRRGLSKEVIRALAAHFKLSQEAFNRPYALRTYAQPEKEATAAKLVA